ncbi:MAG TPA: DUF3429 domain-containing protein [Mesorhizobium sp.]|nr:DUF3429 domain-containing protein [Mesorhizobium sp.]
MDQDTRIPPAALILGWAGVIPFAGLALATILGWNFLPVFPAGALTTYGAIILSFLGGAQWGITVRAGEPEGAKTLRYAVAVLPALWGWFCLFLFAPYSLWSLAAGHLLLLGYDLSTVRSGIAPRWHGRLRIQLALAAALSLGAAALVSR